MKSNEANVIPPSKAKLNKRRLILPLAGALALLAIGLLCTLAQNLDPASTVPRDPQLNEPSSRLYVNPQPTVIDGYDDHCMEPQVTGDGKYLLFNNSNGSFVDTHIHICKRTGDNHFQHLGLLPGSVSKSKDMAPTLDGAGNMYFTCLKTFEKDGHSIYVAKFADEKLSNFDLPQGDISPHKPAEINMDCGVSKDGNTLILSRAHFANYFLPPDRCDLVIAARRSGTFAVRPEQQKFLAEQNTSALEYAPCLSSDELELFYTRCGKVSKDDKRADNGVYFRNMYARRASKFEPFGKPHVLSELAGFVEAPTVTDDGKEMFYHKKMGDKFRIFRALRSPAQAD